MGCAVLHPCAMLGAEGLELCCLQAESAETARAEESKARTDLQAQLIAVQAELTAVEAELQKRDGEVSSGAGGHKCTLTLPGCGPAL